MEGPNHGGTRQLNASNSADGFLKAGLVEKKNFPASELEQMFVLSFTNVVLFYELSALIWRCHSSHSLTFTLHACVAK